MSVFQIPGLGQAKPNEVLPPLASGPAVSSASAQDDEMKDATAPASNDASVESHDSQHQQPQELHASDSMTIDQPESPPSLTGALEAAIGGLGDAVPEELAPPPPPPPQQQQQQEEQVPLGPDQSEHPEWEIDSSPYESSSESSSSSDSSDEEDSDQEGYEPLGIEETARLLMEMEGGSDDEGERGGKASGSGYLRSKNELPEESVPMPDVTITPDMRIEELGAVEHMVDNIILVKAFTPGEYQVLDAGSVLCTAERVVVGAIAETIGKVLQPMYTVMFSSAEDIRELGLEVGTKLYYPVGHASFVFTEPLKNIKGSDASNLHDEEVGDEEIEFSDDEKEAEYKRSLKQKKKDKWKNGGAGREKEPHPLRQETSADDGLKYDEDDDGPYKPLARPAGYGAGPVSVESSYESSSRPRQAFQRGRGRDARGGRGGRGGRSSGRGGRGGFNAPRESYSMPPQGQQQFAPPPPPPPPVAATTASTHGAMPTLPNFGFPLPGWPTPGQTLIPPPPPPVPAGWSPPAGTEGHQAPNPGAFVNPAFFAALMSQMQAQSGQGAWGQQSQQQQQPPPGSGR
ncbi:H/ACA ribonucleoprotein complex non-core subunit NAF1 [Escovopsis weberi]|uniref:H/ACA ribonucleoprotein complex non-core subunit NAF1 n=1 Tax=Escovopsis weberi TaxID=150374 RepID=A0A0M8N9Q0_ESCWE|nr:H/ACA ribonucleoprotein complex non-core subunit NAF1 [Escovopsis weberi]